MFRQAVLVVVLSFVFYVFFFMYTKLGFNYYYKKHYPGDCRVVQGVGFGSEDLEVTKDGLAFISSGLDFPPMAQSFHDFYKSKTIRGRILLFDFDKPELGAQTLKIQPSKIFDPETFRPHGVSLLEDPTKGEHLIYVVNHPDGGSDRVEKFRYIPAKKELQHVRFFNSSKMLITNDLAVVSEDKFYVSNYLYFNHQLMSVVEQMFPIALGGLLYVDGDTVTEVVPGLHGANGVTMSRDKRFLYLALPLDASMQVYEVQKDHGLKLVQEVELHTLPDNFNLAQSGDSLIVGAHPVPYKVMNHMDDPSTLAPSSVLRLPLSPNGLVVHEDITELFYDHGDLISGSTVAQIYGNQMLVGSIINNLVVCDLYGITAVKSS